jgi:MATE family multidrug resistance protein
MSLQSDKIDSDSSVLLDSSPLLHEDKDKAGAAAELRALVALTIPITATFVLEIVPSLVSVLLVGHLGKDYLDASSLANMFSNVTGLSVCLGMATGLDTLVSQAHGAQESKKVGIYLQRALLVQLIVFVPIVLVNFFTADILKLAQQPADVSDLAGRFARYMLPGLPCVALYELLKKTMQAQNSTLPTLLIAVLGNGVNVGVGYWLVHVRDDVGFIGAAIGKSVGQFTLGFALLAYLWWVASARCRVVLL